MTAWCGVVLRARARQDRGSGAVLALALAVVVIVATTAALAVASALSAAHSARAAADLAALAGAGAVSEGQASGCPEARVVAAGHEASVTTCLQDAAGTVTVVATVPVTLRVPGLSPAEMAGRARAGPSEPSPPVGR